MKKIQLVRHEEDEVEGVLRAADRLYTRSKDADQYAEGGELVLAAYRTGSMILAWLPRASASEDSHTAALHISDRNAA